MSYVKRFIDDVMALYEQGVSIGEIAEVLRLERDLVEQVVEQYSNFYD
jgi:orotate phosphoribosyltransferase-like protein